MVIGVNNGAIWTIYYTNHYSLTFLTNQQLCLKQAVEIG